MKQWSCSAVHQAMEIWRCKRGQLTALLTLAAEKHFRAAILVGRFGQWREKPPNLVHLLDRNVIVGVNATVEMDQSGSCNESNHSLSIRACRFAAVRGSTHLDRVRCESSAKHHNCPIVVDTM
jgi:hypothetical protein